MCMLFLNVTKNYFIYNKRNILSFLKHSFMNDTVRLLLDYYIRTLVIAMSKICESMWSMIYFLQVRWTVHPKFHAADFLDFLFWYRGRTPGPPGHTLHKITQPLYLKTLAKYSTWLKLDFFFALTDWFGPLQSSSNGLPSSLFTRLMLYLLFCRLNNEKVIFKIQTELELVFQTHKYFFRIRIRGSVMLNYRPENGRLNNKGYGTAESRFVSGFYPRTILWQWKNMLSKRYRYPVPKPRNPVHH